MRKDDDIEDICYDFKVDPSFVRFVWATLQETGVPGSKLKSFIPQTMRECALGCVIALRKRKK